MYEIWLALNILFELALTALPLIGGLLALWVALLATASTRGRAAWRPALRPSVIIALLIAISAFFAVPTMTKSSMAEMGYWIDWANLAGIAAAIGGVAFALIWPLATSVTRRHE
ncbi:MAG: hypothetical protein KBF58_02485 [Methyloversatilis sp.]|jgi:hypothetical protein|nr:hypothetical protein [Methyloversatilis sp.]MBP6193956.1 hypothetical protein [Methyloversatilis sp.]MBP9116925.1 hypothetical protein [Methyloversatilis sp.]